jgi:hypothetical protein
VDRRLNGTWALDPENPDIKARGGSSPIRVTFNNGNVEYVNSVDGYITQKGTYVTGKLEDVFEKYDSYISQTITHRRDRNATTLREL